MKFLKKWRINSLKKEHLNKKSEFLYKQIREENINYNFSKAVIQRRILNFESKFSPPWYNCMYGYTRDVMEQEIEFRKKINIFRENDIELYEIMKDFVILEKYYEEHKKEQNCPVLIGHIIYFKDLFFKSKVHLGQHPCRYLKL